MTVATMDNQEVQMESKKLIDNDTFRKLHAGDVKFDALNEAQKAEFHERFVAGQEEVPTIEEEKNEPPKAAEQVTNVVKKDEEVSPEERKRREEWKRTRDENNTLQQKLKAAQERIDQVQKMKVEPAPKLEIDEFDDNTKAQHKFNQEIATKLNNMVESETSMLSREVAQLKQESLYSSVAEMQSENPELQTSKSIKALDSAFVRFRDSIAPNANEEVKSKAVEEFLKNPEKRKAVEAEGIMFPFSDEDWNRYKTISAVHGFRAKNNFPDLDSAYYKYKKENGIVTDTFRSVAQDTHRKVVDQITNKQDTTTILSPDMGVSSSTVAGMTEQQAEAWLMRNPIANTPEKRQILDGIMNKFAPK